MHSGVTSEGRGARSVPAGGSTLPAGGDACPTCPVTEPDPRQPSKGSKTRVTRCPLHGIAYDSEREICPECAKEPARVGTPRTAR
jgi:hypothetical protein